MNSKNKNRTVDDIITEKPDLRKKIPKGEYINFYEYIPKKFLQKYDNPNYHLHNLDVPFRMCIVAPSGSGKTNFLCNLIKDFSYGKGTFQDITIVTNNKDEPLYNWLTSLNPIIRVVEGMANTPKLQDFDKNENHLVIWDDLVLNKNQDQARNYYMMARKYGCSLCYLSQSYYSTDKFIRKNSIYLVLLYMGSSNREKKAILSEWAGDIPKDLVLEIYEDATKTHMSPLIIAGGKVDLDKKFRKEFLNYYKISDIINNYKS